MGGGTRRSPFDLEISMKYKLFFDCLAITIIALFLLAVVGGAMWLFVLTMGLKGTLWFFGIVGLICAVIWAIERMEHLK
jgi:hypothetical protein